jgi:eukaryotic-like serine/threonine-protein kinase
MQRSISLISLLAIVALLAFSSWLPGRPVSAGQGKGGEVIAKPTPTPTPKKATTTKRTSPRNSKTSQPAKSANEAATAAEMIFWNSIKDSANPDDFKVYLKKYPNGEFAELAKNKLKTLEPISQPTSTTSNSLGSKSAKPSSAKPPNPPLPLHSFDFVTVTLDSSGNLSSRDHKSAYAYTEDLGGGVKLEMVAIPQGEFMMGSPQNEAGRRNDESPQHRVRIGYWFYFGKFEVTQAQWRAVMGNNPSNFKDCDECPVEQVTWNDSVEFCQKLSARTGREYRLPSEAEWEYAGRAGTTTPFAFGDTITPEIVNYDGSEPYPSAAKGTDRRKTVAAGSLGVANGFGLYDMHGNVREWCQDWYHDGYSTITGDAPADGSAWTSGGTGKTRVLRGGSWVFSAGSTRSASRDRTTPGDHLGSLGFRVVAVR